MVELVDVTKSFHGNVVLSHLSHSFAPGKTHVLLGSSGSGKSTLLRLILGTIKPDSGQIKNSASVKSIGYVPQDAGMFPHLTAEENITLVARLHGLSMTSIRERLNDLCAITNISATLLSKFPKHLSGGQKQRAAIIRAAFLDPSLLILDEPLGALDPIIRADLQQELKKIFIQLKKTVIFVTHDLAEAAYLGDAVILMNQGRFEQTGSFKELMQTPRTEFVREFVNAQKTLHAMDML
jgi:osmoprotectant transport system ATP-binding protein